MFLYFLRAHYMHRVLLSLKLLFHFKVLTLQRQTSSLRTQFNSFVREGQAIGIVFFFQFFLYAVVNL